MPQFYNRYEVEEIHEATRNDPRLFPYADVAYRFMNLVDSCSDGWPYWKGAATSAGTLLEILERATEHTWRRDPSRATDANLKKALGKIKSFCTRKGLAFPEMDT